MFKCFWKRYQETGKFEDMTAWLKHRAYTHQSDDWKQSYDLLADAADDLCADLTMLLIEIDEMGHAGHHVEQIRKALNDNKNLARVVDLLCKRPA